MNWKQQTVVRILLLIAKMLTGDDELRREIDHLNNHIQAHREGKAE